MLLSPIWAAFESSTTDLKSTQFETSFGRTAVEWQGILGNSYVNSSREHAQVLTPRGSIIYYSSFKRGLPFTPMCILHIMAQLYVPEYSKRMKKLNVATTLTWH